jgi:hypothetical protein
MTVWIKSAWIKRSNFFVSFQIHFYFIF